MDNPVCPICGSSECRIELTAGNAPSYYYVECQQADLNFYIENDTFHESDTRLRDEIFALILMRLLVTPNPETQSSKHNIWHFFYEPKYITQESDPKNFVNLAEEMQMFPRTIIARLEQALLNLSKAYPTIGDYIYNEFDSLYLQRILLCTSRNPYEEAAEILNYLTNLGYVEGEDISKISIEGWVKIEELTKKHSEIKQGFIAMSYAPDARHIMEAFREAISSCKYKAQIISEKEHNHQIVPEMFYEIERSKFMVVDVTYQNFGAYYEAGFAQALGKEVIVCCSEEVFNDPKRKPHFDISQKPIIIWKDVDDLKQRLARRIEATVH